MRPCARPSWGRSSRGGGALRRGERASAVLAHQVAVARDIGHKDRRQPAFNLLPAHLVIGPQKTLLLRLRFNPTPSEGEFIVQRVPPKGMAASHEPPGRRCASGEKRLSRGRRNRYARRLLH